MRLARFFANDINLGHASAAVDARKQGVGKFLHKHGRTLAIAGGSAAATLAVVGASPVLKTVVALAGIGMLAGPQFGRIVSKIRNTLGMAAEIERVHAKPAVAEATRRGFAAQAENDTGLTGLLRGVRDYSFNDFTSDEKLHARLPITRKTASAIGFGITAALLGPLAPVMMRAVNGGTEWYADGLQNVATEARFQLEHDLADTPGDKAKADSKPAP